MAEPVRAPESEPDTALAQRCAGGERAAQRELFRRERAQVHRTLYRILGSNRQMEDLVQETFIAAFGAIGSFRGESSLHTWIDTIAARVCYRHLSRRETRTPYLQAVVDDAVAPSPDPERQALSREALRRLYALLDRLEPKYRIAYALHVIDDRPIKEVARITRASSLAVKNRVFRARRTLHARASTDPLLSEFISNWKGKR